MPYIENPKTKGSGIICAIPQTGTCPVGCADCFFQAGRSYLEPLAANLPNMPSSATAAGRILRMNDGNDSNVDRETVMRAAQEYDEVFYNTSIPKRLAEFGRPVVLTLNPGKMTDSAFHQLPDPIPTNLMFVRFRYNAWNADMCDHAISYYTARGVDVALTFMAYYTEGVPEAWKKYYHYKARTTNSYWVLTDAAWYAAKDQYQGNSHVYTCGASPTAYACKTCGNCLRAYYAAKERIRKP